MKRIVLTPFRAASATTFVSQTLNAMKRAVVVACCLFFSGIATGAMTTYGSWSVLSPGTDGVASLSTGDPFADLFMILCKNGSVYSYGVSTEYVTLNGNVSYQIGSQVTSEVWSESPSSGWTILLRLNSSIDLAKRLFNNGNGAFIFHYNSFSHGMRTIYSSTTGFHDAINATRSWCGWSQTDFPSSVQPPPPASIDPVEGIWWNPNESGTGYAIEVQHGTLVVIMYTYNQDGTANFYVATGPVTNNAATMAMNKFRSGQCMTCTYQAPTLIGSDGDMTLTFTSPTTATIHFPGGRVTNIQHMAF